VKYQAKLCKTVVVLTTRHKGGMCQTDGKKKPESGLYYNKNKCGLDMLDAICRQTSTNAGNGLSQCSSTVLIWLASVHE